MVTPFTLSERPAVKPRVSILTYHQIGEFQRPQAHLASYCHVQRFRAQMNCLGRLRYNVISLDAAYEGLFLGKPLPPRPVVLTFDDGYRNFYDCALPILAAHGFPATLFMVTGLLGKTAAWLENDAGQPRPALLDAAALRELHRYRITVGSHTVSHPRLSQLPTTAVTEEISRSKAELENLLGYPVAHFCYPYGDYDERARDAVREAGYQTGLTCIRGAANTASNPFEIPRKGIGYDTHLGKYFMKLHLRHERKDSRRRAARASIKP